MRLLPTDIDMLTGRARRLYWSEDKDAEDGRADTDQDACQNVSYKVYSQKNAGDTEQNAEGEEYDTEGEAYLAQTHSDAKYREGVAGGK